MTKFPSPAGASEAMPYLPPASRCNGMQCQVLICPHCEDGLELSAKAKTVLTLWKRKYLEICEWELSFMSVAGSTIQQLLFYLQSTVKRRFKKTKQNKTRPLTNLFPAPLALNSLPAPISRHVGDNLWVRGMLCALLWGAPCTQAQGSEWKLGASLFEAQERGLGNPIRQVFHIQHVPSHISGCDFYNAFDETKHKKTSSWNKQACNQGRLIKLPTWEK